MDQIFQSIGETLGSFFDSAPVQFGLRAIGVYLIVVYARSTVTGVFDQSRTAVVTLVANPQMSLDIPSDGSTLAQPFSIAGWALTTAWRITDRKEKLY